MCTPGFAGPLVGSAEDRSASVLSYGRTTSCRRRTSPPARGRLSAIIVASIPHRSTRLHVSESALRSEFPLPHPSPTAIFKELDEGGVLLSTSDEVYFGVNPVGARIWSLLPPVSRTFGELCATLEQQYPDAASEQIRADVYEFIDALTASGLVVPATS